MKIKEIVNEHMIVKDSIQAKELITSLEKREAEKVKELKKNTKAILMCNKIKWDLNEEINKIFGTIKSSIK